MDGPDHGLDVCVFLWEYDGVFRFVRVEETAADANEDALADEGVEGANVRALVLHLLPRVGSGDIVRTEVLLFLGEMQILDSSEEEDLGLNAFLRRDSGVGGVRGRGGVLKWAFVVLPFPDDPVDPSEMVDLVIPFPHFGGDVGESGVGRCGTDVEDVVLLLAADGVA